MNEQILRQRIHQLLKRYEIQQIAIQVEKDGPNQWSEHWQQNYNDQEHTPTTGKMKGNFQINIGT
jgi:hypothetical protein